MGLCLSDGDSRNIADTGALDRGRIKEAEGGGGLLNMSVYTQERQLFTLSHNLTCQMHSSLHPGNTYRISTREAAHKQSLERRSPSK